MIRSSIMVSLFLYASFAALPADVTGKWTAQVPMASRLGAREQAFNFKADGDRLSGTLSGRQGDVGIANGKIDGDTVSFTVRIGSNSFEQKYTGTVSGDEITFKSTWPLSGPGREFTARRVK
jgi:hypothetical protein